MPGRERPSLMLPPKYSRLYVTTGRPQLPPFRIRFNFWTLC